MLALAKHRKLEPSHVTHILQTDSTNDNRELDEKFSHASYKRLKSMYPVVHVACFV